MDDPDDSWKDGLGQDGLKEHAQYMAEVAWNMLRELEAKGFSREEAMRLMIAIIPGGFRHGNE